MVAVNIKNFIESIRENLFPFLGYQESKKELEKRGRAYPSVFEEG